MNGVKVYDKVDGLWVPHINLQLFAGNTYYIDYATGLDTNRGTDTNPGGPWKHCPGDPIAAGNAGATILLPGDTIIFRGGITYYGAIVCYWPGTSGNVITYDGNSAETWGSGRAVIDPPANYFFNINGQNYITIKYLEMTGSSHTTNWNDSGIYSLSANSYITIRDC